MRSSRVPCGRRSSVRAIIELGELQRRASCVGVLDGFEGETFPKVENFRRGSSSIVNERRTGGRLGEVRRRKSCVGVLGSQSNTARGEFEEHQDDIEEDSRMIWNVEDQREKSNLAQSMVLKELKDI